ncbi:hypothetical protein GUITHDRAFT_132854 [Guillardia theta CCMP2712]|uniref:Zn(2)-C6 fungal-type domain-containing protein n=1 Tax=Guillardia theta (strain CCMP2712) TaxID=905079 RepID=L1K057_GUITC|nr:hypothetical protein GUITHDRAFT_132854 [Guillardia theta CCMP2712]EKX53805.1 hypothetical protein GUITHDRAFT_132854 [Guillardia theta CCMP2712]|eukprot:XP_005840785.1 hypothetical protein GUITHDRAFT_132854 [Guillardia theta CCMP2712]
MKRISLACKPCKDIKSKCDNFQPCTRCVQSNIADQCIRLRVARGARKRSTVACIPCKRAKLKCDEERPCSRCKRLGREWDCIDEQLELIQSQLVDLNEDQFDRLDVSKEDFESRLLNAADPFVRLLKIINLDRERSYDRWMSDFDADMYAGETILGMQKSKEGQERLLALSRELETLYGPFVARAEQILQQRLRELSTEQPVTAVNVMHKLPGQFQPPVSATGQSETLRPTMSEGT